MEEQNRERKKEAVYKTYKLIYVGKRLKKQQHESRDFCNLFHSSRAIADEQCSKRRGTEGRMSERDFTGPMHSRVPVHRWREGGREAGDALEGDVCMLLERHLAGVHGNQ